MLQWSLECVFSFQKSLSFFFFFFRFIPRSGIAGSYGSSISGIFLLENVRCSELLPSISLFQSLPPPSTSRWILDPQEYLLLPRSHRCCLPFPNKLLLILYISAPEITDFQALCSNLNSYHRSSKAMPDIHSASTSKQIFLAIFIPCMFPGMQP